MEKTDEIIEVNNKKIKVSFEEFIIHITIDNELTELLAHETETQTDHLVDGIKAKYLSLFNKDLDIKNASMAVEIWGHTYADKFATAIKSIATFDFLEKLIEKIIERCEVIDIGERSHDYNRFFWDALAPLKSAIAKLLPKK